jgi:hypothetical protein
VDVSTSGLAWMYHLYADRKRYPEAPAPAAGLPRSRGWIAAGVVAAVVFVAVLGPSIRF